jgi:hypothetical protein
MRINTAVNNADRIQTCRRLRRPRRRYSHWAVRRKITAVSAIAHGAAHCDLVSDQPPGVGISPAKTDATKNAPSNSQKRRQTW